MTTQTHPESEPGGRWGHAFVHDPIRDEFLLFGGGRERGTYLGDTWTWDGTAWRRRDAAGPSARGFASVAFHPKRGTAILHGGRGNGRITHSDTWEWDGSHWREIEAESPYRADHHRIVYVSHEERILGFGGWDGEDVSGGTWIWDGSWKQEHAEGPRKRGAFAMAYDEHEHRMVLCGGLWLDGQYADLWEWRNRHWRQLGGPYENSSVDHHAMVYESARRRVLMFGGKNYRYRPLATTRTIEGDRVITLAEEGPSPRHSIGLAYDTRRQRVVLFGGKEYIDDSHGALGDLWGWDGKAWAPLSG